MPPKRVAFQAPQPEVAAKRKPVPAARYAFSFRTAFAVFAVLNSVAATYSPIQDCDEVFNYWEPTHYLLHGYGRQTWEYSPDFAIRDWLYVSVHAVLAKLSGLLLQPLSYLPPVLLAQPELAHGGKVAEFYGLRLCLGLLCAACQARFVAAIGKTLNPRVAIFTGMVMVSSTGFFHAGPAFLPSSFAMCMGMVGAAAFMDWKLGVDRTGAMTHGSNAGIMWFGIGAVFGWPFAGALVFPFLAEELVVAVIAEDLVDLLRKWLDGTVRTMVFIILQLGINAFFYHKVAIVPWNIVVYNIFGGKDRGPDIYGTEPADFYLKNLFLNFNIWLLLALAAGPLVTLQWRFGTTQGTSKLTLMRSVFFTAPFYMWLAIFSAQPHKEERFMYPAYPFIALNAALAFHAILTFVGNASPRTLMGKLPAQIKLLFIGALVLLAIDLGVFRTVGMITGYRAPMIVYGALQNPGAVSPGDTICLGKEWYRFPSSFFLPNQAHAKFVRSEFDGLLPGEFREAHTGFGLFPGTWMIPSGMNDRNEFEPETVIDVRGCNYLIDSHSPGNSGSKLEPNYAASKEWEQVHCADFLDAANTHILGRLLWLPDHEFIPDRFKRKWNQFCLLRRRA